jgi:hypothetical protein
MYIYMYAHLFPKEVCEKKNHKLIPLICSRKTDRKTPSSTIFSEYID